MEKLTVEEGDNSQCHSCNKSRESLSSPLNKCAGCGKAWYCSKDCQKEDWKDHKPRCLKSRTASRLDGITHYNTVAYKIPQAQELAQTINLTLPTSSAIHEGIVTPLRRLVMTGKDTAKNLELFFGPNWRSSMRLNHEEVRIEVLLNPPPGSPAYVLAASMHMDDDAPAWSPRPVSDSEKRTIDEVRAMQSLVRERVGAGQSPSNAVMKDILTSFGANWVDKLPLYQLAVNTMDQGVQVQ
ncbi:hypothetical protein P280DRAFT_480825 [Massarina eburnea CBS 473.64]|uniref:MYND-type domain-containing protein n=1 Tax=Massarina eburnea CBS 473.64 TaxID=1395130 RepID=A0A6A6RZK3_9PLEO|nr:hypothetical protein P280DRAFT_480825 [Massarina eburnea CBS 473.64]